MFYIGLAMSRCTVTGCNKTVRFQTICMQNSKLSIGMVVTEFLTWEDSGDVVSSYEVQRHEGKYSSIFIETQGQMTAKRTVVRLVDEMEAAGDNSANARFESGYVGDLNKCESSDEFMEHLQKLTQDKQLIMEVRKVLLGEKLAEEAYKAWGSW